MAIFNCPRVTWCPCDRGCAGPRWAGKPLQLAVDRVTGTTEATQLVKSAFGRIVLQNSFWGDDQNFSGPLMRFARGDMRDHIRSRLRISFCEIFGAAQFSTFATQSSRERSFIRPLIFL